MLQGLDQTRESHRLNENKQLVILEVQRQKRRVCKTCWIVKIELDFFLACWILSWYSIFRQLNIVWNHFLISFVLGQITTFTAFGCKPNKAYGWLGAFCYVWGAPSFFYLKKGSLSYILVDMHRWTRLLVGCRNPVPNVFWRCTFFAHTPIDLN